MGDFFAMALHDDQLRSGLVAMHQEGQRRGSPLMRIEHSGLAAALRGLARVVDALKPGAHPDRPLAHLRKASAGGSAPKPAACDVGWDCRIKCFKWMCAIQLLVRHG